MIRKIAIASLGGICAFLFAIVLYTSIKVFFASTEQYEWTGSQTAYGFIGFMLLLAAYSRVASWEQSESRVRLSNLFAVLLVPFRLPMLRTISVSMSILIAFSFGLRNIGSVSAWSIDRADSGHAENLDYESKGLAIEKSINELTLEEIDLPGAPASMQLERESSERSPERIRESDIDLYLDSRVYEKGNLRAETASIQVSPPRPGIFTLEAFNKELELCEVRLLNVRLRLLATERAQADLRAELSILESTHLEYQTQLQELIDLNAELLEVVPWYSLRKAEPVVPETGDQLRSDIPNQG